MIPHFVYADLQSLGFELPEAALDRLERYLDLVLERNRTTNLTAIRNRELAWSRLIVDSLTPLAGLDGLEAGAAVADIGSGAGLPGIPLAIARPDLAVSLVEATGKKAAFLRDAAAALRLDRVSVLQERVETLGRNPAHRQHYDVALSRAIGPMPVVLEYSLPLLKIGGRALAMKGPRVEHELDASGDALTRLGGGEVAVIDAYPGSFNNDLVIVVVTKAAPTPAAYPRSPGTPKKEPL